MTTQVENLENFRLEFTSPTKTPIAIMSGTAKATHFNFLCTFKNFQGTHI